MERGREYKCNTIIECKEHELLAMMAMCWDGRGWSWKREVHIRKERPSPPDLDYSIPLVSLIGSPSEEGS